MRVQLIAQTQFTPPDDVPWRPHISDHQGSALVEFAGRACYQSWGRPNPKTATNAGYLAHILEAGHESVLEHASVTFYITGVSRSLTHELIRHRHFSYSQLSQRYVDESNTQFVMPPLVAKAHGLDDTFDNITADALISYKGVVDELAARFPNASRKQIREAARAVLPNATETKVVVTGNYRAWRHFIHLRATEAADVEIRALAVECLRQLWGVAPAVFTDFAIVQLEDGTEVAEVAEGAWGQL
jgi:thymidylate synthase (FAD)